MKRTDADPGGPLKIADLERLSGVKRSTVHHYLNLGLLPRPERRGPKLHWFDRSHVARLEQIGRLRRRGFSLAAIRERLSTGGRATSLPERAREESPPRPGNQGEGSRTRGKGQTATSPPSSASARGRDDAPVGQRPRGPARRRVLDAAARLFTDQGYERVHVSEVARAAGVGKATLYQYFKSKSDLFVACLDRLIDVTTAAQSQFIARQGESLLTDMERYAAAMIASFPSYRMMVSALGAAAFGDDPKLAARARDAFMRLVTTFEPALRTAMAEGRCRELDPEMLTYMTWGALMAVGARVNHGDRRYTLLEGMRIYLDFVTFGVAPRRREAR